MIEALENKLAGLTAQLHDLGAAGKIDTPEFRNASDAHALLTSLIDNRGGSPEQQIEFVQRMKLIADR